ncbi:MAG: DUF2961 domain-containing protein [Pseudomonadales bacterium]|nr:DUF2961 domain-containing protein [Pseudomonadales bacterium]
MIKFLSEQDFVPDTELTQILHFIDFSNDTESEWILTGPATIRRFSITFDTLDQDLLNNLTLKIRWDDRSADSIDLRLMDFFAASQTIPTVSNLILSVDTENDTDTITLNIDLPMPYMQQAVISVSSETLLDATLELSAYLSIDDLPDQAWGYMSAQFNETLAAPDLDPFHPFFNHTGRGRLVGVCAQLQGQSSTGIGGTNNYSFLEGDEIAMIDGAERILGTGTEDYFNSSFYFRDEANATPFAQYWGKSVDEANDEENISACRWHLFHDTIDYRENIDFKLEIGPLTPEALKRYRTVAYYYTD